MTGTFSERIAELRHLVGDGQRLQGSVTCDQVYAHRQHEDLSYRHPRGGQAKFLEKPLFDHYRDYLSDYAKTVLTDDGAVMRSKRPPSAK